MLIKAVCVCPPTSTKLCCCVSIPEPFEYVGVKPVMEKPASAIGGPLLVVRSSVYAICDPEDVGARRSILFEYEAEDCHVEAVAIELGHMPPKM